MSDVDDYQLPDGILGRHPEEFFAATGRVVCLCAVLEDKVTTLRHTLQGAEQGAHTHEPVGQQIRSARARALTLPAPTSHTVMAYLDEVAAAFGRRNELVHSAFPAQADGRLWGHRPTRDRSVTDGRADEVETTVAGLCSFIAELAHLVRSFNDVHALAVTAVRP